MTFLKIGEKLESRIGSELSDELTDGVVNRVLELVFKWGSSGYLVYLGIVCLGFILNFNNIKY